MWMEEKLGTRINSNRTAEAVATGADTIAIGCPFCRVMISDGLTAAQDAGEAREEVEVLDVAQLLLASVKRSPAEAAPPGEPKPAGEPVETKAEPEPGDLTQTENTVSDTEDVGALATAHEEPDPAVESARTAADPDAEGTGRQTRSGDLGDTDNTRS